MRAKWSLWVLLASFGGHSLDALANHREVVAVFDLQSKGIELEQEALTRLSDYLASRLAGVDGYSVVPKEQIRAQIAQKKADSYLVCYDEACQVEIGRELAAQKSLAALVIRLGSGCAVSLTLYDLRTAATERAATMEGGCSEDEIVLLLRNGIDDLARSASAARATAERQRSANEPRPARSVEATRELDLPVRRSAGLEVGLDLGYATSFGGFTGGAGPSISLSTGYRFGFSDGLFVRPDAIFRFLHLFTAPSTTDYGLILGASVVVPLGAVEIGGGVHAGPLFSFAGFFADVRGNLSLVLSHDFALQAGIAYERYFDPPLGDSRLADFLQLTAGLSRVWD